MGGDRQRRREEENSQRCWVAVGWGLELLRPHSCRRTASFLASRVDAQSYGSYSARFFVTLLSRWSQWKVTFGETMGERDEQCALVCLRIPLLVAVIFPCERMRCVACWALCGYSCEGDGQCALWFVRASPISLLSRWSRWKETFGETIG